ncbi:MAG: tRNA-dihydrouridine synthase family protein [Desulfobacterium sp.]|jgi:nifR3 family TIM-barrel protein|nr:tRNA-dihydrouridine synthase family protein [Desulfobacterium sp.]
MRITQGITIGKKRIENRLFLAPMAGLGHAAFREVVSEFGGYGLLFTGMCSAKALPHENPAVSPVFKWRKSELATLVCQIFGPDPLSMALAAQRIEREGFFGVDLNFGCSVAAICKRGCGAALLRDPDLAVEILARVRGSVTIPVFVKFRTGWTSDPAPAVELAKRFEDKGADALVFHPRVAPDRRSRPPRWEQIALLSEAVSIPVFGNGNVFDMNDLTNMVEQTGCDGVSIGRIAVSRPWIFAEWTRGFTPTISTYHRTALRLTELLLKHHKEKFAVKLYKKFIPYFSANFRFGHSICKELLKADTMEELRENIDGVFDRNPEIVARPNINLFL